MRLSPLLGTYYYIFKTKKEPWSNPKLRHAISKAIDRDYLAEKVWQNAMFPAYSMVPPGVAGYTTSTTDYAVAAQLDREDEAKKLFDGARHIAGKAGENGAAFQHIGQSQEHGGGHSGHAETVRL